GVCAHRALQEGLQVRERNLAVLVLHQCVVGLDALKPCSEVQQVDSVSPRELIGHGVQIANRRQIAPRVRAPVGNLRGPVDRRTAAYYDGTHRLPGMDPGRAGAGGSDGDMKRFATEAQSRFPVLDASRAACGRSEEPMYE